MNFIDFIQNLFHQPYFISLISLITCSCFYYIRSENKKHKKIVWAVYSFIFITAFFIFIGSAIYRVIHPVIWDFNCFYLYGKVAATGHNYYSPEDFHLVFSSLNIPYSTDHDFIKEVVDVGMLYPPPTILYFLPLGFLSFKTALIVWTILILLFAFGCIYLIYKIFFKDNKVNGVLLVSILFFILSPSLYTISASQINFILFFWLLLMKKYSDENKSGIFLALAVFTKPYMAIFGLVLLLRMKWKAIVYCFSTAFVLIGVTMLFSGKGVFVSYIFDNPLHRVSPAVFYEQSFQSLYAVLLRANLINTDTPGTYVNILLGLGMATIIYLVYLLNKKSYDYIWVVLLLVALIAYPNTLRHYGVVLLFVTFQFFDEKKQLGFKPFLNIPIIAIFYYLSTFSVFTSICFILGLLVFKSIGWPISRTFNVSPNIK